MAPISVSMVDKEEVTGRNKGCEGIMTIQKRLALLSCQSCPNTGDW